MNKNVPSPAFETTGTDRRRLWSILIPAMALLAPAVLATDWPQFRGTQGDGISSEVDLSRSWPEGGPPELWRQPLGEGFSALSIAGDQIFTLFAEGEDEVVASYRVKDGSEVWRRKAGKKFLDHWGNGPRATPAVDGDTVYALASNGTLLALGTADGQTVWKVELEERFGSANRPLDLGDAAPPGHAGGAPFWGYCSSPWIEDDLLIVYTGAGKGNSMVALDKATGETRWNRLDHHPSYSSPYVVALAGERQIVTAMADEIVSLSLAGDQLWSYPWARFNVSQPVFVPPNRLFFSSPNDVGGIMLAIHKTAQGMTVEEVWRERRMRNTWQSSIAHDGTIVGFDNATLKVLSQEGEVLWAKRGLGKGSLTMADDLLFLLSDRGVLTVAEWSREGFRQLSQQTVLSGATLTAPVIAKGKLFLRDHQEMVCLDLRSKQTTREGSP